MKINKKQLVADYFNTTTDDCLVEKFYNKIVGLNVEELSELEDICSRLTNEMTE